MDKNKLLHRISEKEAKKREMDMKLFYRKRNNGLMPFLNSDGEIEWLKRENFRIITVKKITDKSKINNPKQHNYKRRKDDDIDLKTLFFTGKSKYFFYGASTVTGIVLFIRFVFFIFGN